MTVTTNARSDNGWLERVQLPRIELHSIRQSKTKQIAFPGCRSADGALPSAAASWSGTAARSKLRQPSNPAATDGSFVRKLLTTDAFDKAALFVSLIEYINKIVLTAAPEGEHVANKDRRDFFYRASLRAIFNYTSLRRQVAYEKFSPQKSRTQQLMTRNNVPACETKI